MLSEFGLWVYLHKNWFIGYSILVIFNGLVFLAYTEKWFEVVETLCGKHISK